MNDPNPATSPPAGPLADIAQYKQQARRLREAMAEQGAALTHGAALEVVARQHGARDWNTLVAQARREPPRDEALFAVGSAVCGRYLNQSFTGRILSVSMTAADGLHRLVIHFDKPVDVVTFDSFSAYRSRITAVVDRHGVSPRKTSNGVAHLVIDAVTKA